MPPYYCQVGVEVRFFTQALVTPEMEGLFVTARCGWRFQIPTEPPQRPWLEGGGADYYCSPRGRCRHHGAWRMWPSYHWAVGKGPAAC